MSSHLTSAILAHGEHPKKILSIFQPLLYGSEIPKADVGVGGRTLGNSEKCIIIKEFH